MVVKPYQNKLLFPKWIYAASTFLPNDATKVSIAKDKGEVVFQTNLCVWKEVIGCLLHNLMLFTLQSFFLSNLIAYSIIVMSNHSASSAVHLCGRSCRSTIIFQPDNTDCNFVFVRVCLCVCVVKVEMVARVGLRGEVEWDGAGQSGEAGGWLLAQLSLPPQR